MLHPGPRLMIASPIYVAKLLPLSESPTVLPRYQYLHSIIETVKRVKPSDLV